MTRAIHQHELTAWIGFFTIVNWWIRARCQKRHHRCGSKPFFHGLILQIILVSLFLVIHDKKRNLGTVFAFLLPVQTRKRYQTSLMFVLAIFIPERLQAMKNINQRIINHFRSASAFSRSRRVVRSDRRCHDRIFGRCGKATRLRGCAFKAVNFSGQILAASVI